MRHIGNHSRVVRFLGLCHEPANLGLLLEFLPLGSVEKVMQVQGFRLGVGTEAQRKRNLTALVQMAIDASAGLLHCHSRRVIHRDVAARNFLLTSNENVMIADFGMSVILESTEDEYRTIKQEALPLLWTAPEALRTRQYTFKSDVHSFGIFLYELLIPTPPYAELGNDDLKIAREVVEKDARPEIPGFCPRAVAVLMKHCWHPDAAQRLSMDKVNQALLSIKQELASKSYPILVDADYFGPSRASTAAARATEVRGLGKSQRTIRDPSYNLYSSFSEKH